MSYQASACPKSELKPVGLRTWWNGMNWPRVGDLVMKTCWSWESSWVNSAPPMLVTFLPWSHVIPFNVNPGLINPPPIGQQGRQGLTIHQKGWTPLNNKPLWEMKGERWIIAWGWWEWWVSQQPLLYIEWGFHRMRVWMEWGFYRMMVS